MSAVGNTNYKNYKVVSGDTLSQIAARNHTTVDALAKANGIKNPDKLQAGKTIKVPDNFDRAPRAPLPQTGDGGTPAPTQGSYTVRPGDTLSQIAKNLHSTVSELAKANGIQNPDHIGVGQRISVPGGGSSSPAPAQNQPAPAQNQPAPAQTRPAPGNNTPSAPAPANNAELGSLSRKYEARGPGTVSRGKGDNGGVSYGSYQFPTKNGSAQKFVNSLRTSHPEYHAALAGKEPGTKAFTDAWKQLAAKDPKGFDQAQHDYVKKTHYDVSAKEIKSATGIDLNTRSQALRDVAWSTSVQHGPGAADTIFKRALAGRDPSQVSDAELIKDIYAERGRKDANGTMVHFKSSSREFQRGIADRFRDESRDALSRLGREGQGGGTTAPTPAPAQSRPQAPASQTRPQAPTPQPRPQAPTPQTRPQAPAQTQPTTGGQGARQVNVPYFSQFEGGHGYTPSDTACFKAATAMARAAGVTVTGPGDRIQLGTSEDRAGRLNVNPQRAAEGRNYIDGQLNAGRPVVVGVSHKDANYNADGLTDHFVTITGRGTDANGRTYYTFHDPGTRHTSKGADTNPNNRFYVDERTGGLYRPGSAATGSVTDRHYDVAMVRRNA